MASLLGKTVARSPSGSQRSLTGVPSKPSLSRSTCPANRLPKLVIMLDILPESPSCDQVLGGPSILRDGRLRLGNRHWTEPNSLLVRSRTRRVDKSKVAAVSVSPCPPTTGDRIALLRPTVSATDPSRRSSMATCGLLGGSEQAGAGLILSVSWPRAAGGGGSPPWPSPSAPCGRPRRAPSRSPRLARGSRAVRE